MRVYPTPMCPYAAGYSKRAFVEVLGTYGVPVLSYPVEELLEEIEG